MVSHSRFLFALGAIAGAAGVALLAIAAHRTGGDLATAALFLLVHAPALLALSVDRFGRMQIAGGWMLVVGLVLFCGDLCARAFLGHRLFPMAAPAGGLLLIGGWLVAAASALFTRRG